MRGKPGFKKAARIPISRRLFAICIRFSALTYLKFHAYSSEIG